MTALVSPNGTPAPATGREPRLSITVLNYNYGHFLEQCLNSILSQSYTDFEVIVIDDCSKDNSISVVEPFFEDRRVRLIAHSQNAGFVRSLIEGAEASSSPYLTVVSADDFVLTSTAFEKQMAVLEDSPRAGFCYSSWTEMDRQNTPVGEVVPFPEDHVWAGEQEFKQLCMSFYVMHTGTIIRRTAYNAVGGYDASFPYSIDGAMWAALCGAGDVAYLAEPLYGYRIHGANMSRSQEAAQAITVEMIRRLELGFESLPDGPVKSDRRLRRRALQIALATAATSHVFDGRPIDGSKALAYAARLRPRETLFQRRVISLAARTMLGARGFGWLRSRTGGPVPWYKAG